MNIYEKLLKIKESVEYLKKAQRGNQYDFVSSSQVIAALRAKMNTEKLLLVPNVEDAKFSAIIEKTSAKGNPTADLLTEVFITYKWINAENPEETLSVRWYGQGVDTNGEKGVGKAYTYAEKYFLLKFFNIPTDKDDPDLFEQKQKIKNKNTINDDTDIHAEIECLNSFKELQEYYQKYKSVVSDLSAFNKAINERNRTLKGKQNENIL